MLDDADSALPTTPTGGGGDERLLPGSRLGRFTILRLLGAGGMGAVYEARDPQLDRSVAIKVLPGRGSDDLRLRLVREAQALAQLQHPNVVAVHEVGVADGRVFIAMELIDGVTLDRHLKEAPHGWRDVVELYVHAGRGLVAAHAKGLIHRDFKPGNVLVSVDGRVRVTDFGLARLGQAKGEGGEDGSEDGARAVLDSAVLANATTMAGDSETEAAPSTPAVTPLSDQALLATPLTDAGALLGTRRYMAPEQFSGKAASAQSDQFSFCVALWESLFGQHPFAAGKELGGLAATVAGARILPPPRGAAPRRLVQLLTRGLAADPAQRHPSMTALVDALAGLPLRRRRLTIAAAGVAIAAAAAVAAVTITGTGGVDCARAGHDLDDLWTAATRASLTTRFAGLRPYGADTATRVGAALDTWTRRWRDTRIDACRATHDRGEQSADLLDRRAACLDRGRLALSTLVTAFGSADGDTVDHALDAALTLPSADNCSPAAVASSGPRSSDPRAILIEAYLRASETQWNLGHWDQSIHQSEAALFAARALGDVSLRARALAAHGGHIVQRSAAEARALFESALLDAATVQDRDTTASASMSLLEEAAADKNVTRIQTLLPIARASAEATQTAEVRQRMARVEYHAVAAIGQGENLRATCDQPSLTALDRQDCLCLIARVEWDADRTIRECETLVTDSEKFYGAKHPAVITGLSRIAAAYDDHGDHERALATQERIHALVVAAFGPRSQRAAESISSMANSLGFLNRHAEARKGFEEAIAIFEGLGDKPTLSLGRAYVNLGDTLSDMGDNDHGIEATKHGLQIAEAVVGPDHREIALMLMGYGNILESAHRFDEAIAVHVRGEAIARKEFGELHQITLGHIVMQAYAQVEAGRPALAVAPAERALGLLLKDPSVSPQNVANTRVALGTALAMSGQRERGLRELRQARSVFASLGNAGSDEVKSIDGTIVELFGKGGPRSARP